jgi:hypothetical protein
VPGRGDRELIAGVNGFNAIEGVKAINAQFEGDEGGRVMREGCKSSGASEAWGSGVGGAVAQRNSDRGRLARGRG